MMRYQYINLKYTIKSKNMKSKLSIYLLTVLLSMLTPALFGQDTIKEKPQRIMKADSASDMRWFRRESQIKLNGYQFKLEQLREKKFEANVKQKEEHDQKVLALELRNNALRKRLKESEGMRPRMWSAFKRDFSNDQDELERDIKIAEDRSSGKKL